MLRQQSPPADDPPGAVNTVLSSTHGAANTCTIYPDSLTEPSFRASYLPPVDHRIYVPLFRDTTNLPHGSVCTPPFDMPSAVASVDTGNTPGRPYRFSTAAFVGAASPLAQIDTVVTGGTGARVGIRGRLKTLASSVRHRRRDALDATHGRTPRTPPSSTVDRRLDQVKLLSSILAAVADGPLNVPVLKSVAQLTEKIVTITQVRGSLLCTNTSHVSVQTARANKADCDELATRICDHLNVIATFDSRLTSPDQSQHSALPAYDFRRHIELLHE